MPEVITATEQLSLSLRLGWAWLRPQPVRWGEGSVCPSEACGARQGAVADVRPAGGRTLHSRSELLSGHAGCSFSL